jgi:ribosomal protein S18 acetylase RimI-like enzyme
LALTRPKAFRPLIELENKVRGTFYINVLATCPSARNLGVARTLIEDAAPLAGGADLSLIVSDTNDAAISCYHRSGFQGVASARAVGGFGWEPKQARWILMRRARTP